MENACCNKGTIATDRECVDNSAEDCLEKPAIGKEAVVHPDHYGGGDNPYECIKVIDAWQLGFNLGNCVKYINRLGKKDPTKTLEEMKKARFYLDHAIQKFQETGKLT